MKKLRPTLLILALATAAWGCESNDLGRYCVVGQEKPPPRTEGFGQSSLTILNIEAPECSERICLQQGPYKLHPKYNSSDPPPTPDSCDESWCSGDYRCKTFELSTPIGDGGMTVTQHTRCVYEVRAVCTKECTKHKNCKMGDQNANPTECSEYVCHKQADGEAFEGHCICLCKEFLISPGSEPPRFYLPDEDVNEPENCK